MSSKKNDASAVVSNNASSSIPAQSIAQAGGLGQFKSRRRWAKRKHSLYHYMSHVPNMALKFYDEQLPYGFDYLRSAIQLTNKTDFQVLAIKHDRDTYADQGHFWAPAFEKPHYHVILRCVDRKKRIYVKNVLDALGIVYRPNIDDSLWANHGAEGVWDFAGYATYLTHETADAIKDGKEPYDVSEIISNLTADEIKDLRDGYLNVSSTGRVDKDVLRTLDATAYQLGYELKNFDKWYDALDFDVRSHSKIKTIKESYNRGVNARVAENTEVLRLCVYIQGDHNTGKTYAAKKALCGKSIHIVEGGGSGKFDNLRADHAAIIISDDVCPNVLNMTDNYICRAYRRQANNPAWSGQYFIVTSNVSFEEWLTSCGLNVRSKHYQAMLSRFYICEIKQKADGTNYLALRSASTRGTVKEQADRAGLFMDFKKKFDDTMADYKPDTDRYDYSDMIDPCFADDTSVRVIQTREEKLAFLEAQKERASITNNSNLSTGT